MDSLEARLRRLESYRSSAGAMPDPWDEIPRRAGIAVKCRLGIAGEADDGRVDDAVSRARTILDDDGPDAARVFVDKLFAEARQLAGPRRSIADALGLHPADFRDSGRAS